MGQPIRYPYLQDPEWLREQYVTLGRSSSDIASDFGAPPRTVLKALARAGIQRRDDHLKRHHELRDVSWLRREYVTLGRTSTAIAQELGAHSSTVLDALDRAGIPKRGGGASTRYPKLHDEAWLLHDEAWLRKQVASEGRTVTEVAPRSYAPTGEASGGR